MLEFHAKQTGAEDEDSTCVHWIVLRSDRLRDRDLRRLSEHLGQFTAVERIVLETSDVHSSRAADRYLTSLQDKLHRWSWADASKYALSFLPTGIEKESKPKNFPISPFWYSNIFEVERDQYQRWVIIALKKI